MSWLWAISLIPERCLQDMHYKQQAQNILPKSCSWVMAHAIPIKPTKASFILKGEGIFDVDTNDFPFQKEAS